MMRSPIGFVLLVSLVIHIPATPHASTINKDAGTPDPDSKLVWYDATLLGIENKGWKETKSDYDRLPQTAEETVRPRIWELSRRSAGLQVRFATDTRTLKVRWTLTESKLALTHMPATGVSGIDIYYRDKAGKLQFCANGRPGDRTNEASINLPASNEYVLYLPLYNGIESLELGIPADKTLSTVAQPSLEQTVVFYGTSITQGACASRPGMAATTIVGRKLDVPVINLGFSGNGRMEIEMAELLAELDPAVYVLDCLWNMNCQTLSERLEPFITKLRKHRPTTPILLAEDSNFRNQPTKKGAILKQVCAKLTEKGDRNLYVLPNKGMLGSDMEGTVDGCHPNDLGMSRQAAVFVKALEPILSRGD